MIEPTITADDLTLYALNLLEGEEQVHVEAMLRKSTAAREELANIRGDLAMFALAAEQHTPPSLTRQRLLKQVARERRTVPVELPLQDDGAPSSQHTFGADRGNSDPRAGNRVTSSRSVVGRGTGERDAAARNSGMGRSAAPSRPSGEMAARAQRPMPAELTADARAQEPARNGSPVQARTSPSRSQVRATSAIPSGSALPVPRVVQEPHAIGPESAVASFTADTVGFSADIATFSAERQTFSPDPQVFPREARAMASSATAHSVTMFEQHFATDTVPQSREPEVPPDPEAYSGRKRNEADAVSSVEDRFVPSGASREENFGFSSYRDREMEEPRSNVFGRWLSWAGWGVAAAVAVAAAVTLRDEFNLREQVSQQQSTLATAEANSAKAETVLQTLQSPSSQHFLVARTDAAPAPSGRVAYLPERGTLVFQGSNLETLQPYKTYELWLIPAGEGRQPLPAGLFKPDGHGYATVVLPQMQQGIIAANFGVTIEDEGGSATPTLPIILVGQQS